MKKQNIYCPYCNAPAVLRPAHMVHGAKTNKIKSYLYICSRWPECDSYVSAHQKSLQPMGTLANKTLRRKRILAHKALEQYRIQKHMEKWAVYLWLQGKLGLTEAQAHIGMFSEQMCEQVVALCRQSLSSAKYSAA